MRTKRYLLGRLAWSVVVAWIVFTVTFLVFVWMPDNNLNFVLWGMANDPEAQQRIMEQYRQQMNYHLPLHERYLHWLTAYATFDWGQSLVQERPVAAIVGDAAPVTLAYLVPSVLLSFVAGAALGLYSTVRRGPLEKLGRLMVYVGLALPAFWFGWMLLYLVEDRYDVDLAWQAGQGVFAGDNLAVLALPIVVMTVNLTAAQARYTRAESAEYVVADFTKTIRASGGSAADVARHVFRNALVPLTSLFFTRTLTVLLLSVYVIERVFHLPGLGTVTLNAIQQNDVAVILAMTIITVGFGVLGNLLQDVAYAFLDPRLEDTE